MTSIDQTDRYAKGANVVYTQIILLKSFCKHLIFNGFNGFFKV